MRNQVNRFFRQQMNLMPYATHFGVFISMYLLSDIAIADTRSIFETFLPSPNLQVAGDKLLWNLPPLEYAVGVMFGLALALLSVHRFVANKSKSKPLIISRAFSPFSYSKALLKNEFAWLYVLLIVGFAGLIYSGVFSLLREKLEASMPTWVSWGPAGASVFATFTWTLLSRNFSWFKAGGGVQLEKVVDDLEEKSAADKEHWVQTIAWTAHEYTCESKASELANLYGVGLIRNAVQDHCNAAIDRGRLDYEDVENILTDIASVSRGDNDRERFVNRRLAIHIASRVIPLEELEQVINSVDRRASDRRQEQNSMAQKTERRKEIHRRVDGLLIPEAA